MTITVPPLDYGQIAHDAPETLIGTLAPTGGTAPYVVVDAFTGRLLFVQESAAEETGGAATGALAEASSSVGAGTETGGGASVAVANVAVDAGSGAETGGADLSTTNAAASDTTLDPEVGAVVLAAVAGAAGATILAPETGGTSAASVGTVTGEAGPDPETGGGVLVNLSAIPIRPLVRVEIVAAAPLAEVIATQQVNIIVEAA